MQVSPVDKLVIKSILAGGSAIYLFALGFTMLIHPLDFLAAHGEPILIFILALFCTYEGFNYARRIPESF